MLLNLNITSTRNLLRENLLHMNEEFKGYELLIFLSNLGLIIDRKHISNNALYKLSGRCNDSSIDIENLSGVCINRIHIDSADSADSADLYGGQYSQSDEMSKSLLEYVSNELNLGQVPVKRDNDWWCLNHGEDQLWVKFTINAESDSSDEKTINIVLKKHGNIIDNETFTFVDNEEIKEHVVDEGLFA